VHAFAALAHATDKATEDTDDSDGQTWGSWGQQKPDAKVRCPFMETFVVNLDLAVPQILVGFGRMS